MENLAIKLTVPQKPVKGLPADLTRNDIAARRSDNVTHFAKSILEDVMQFRRTVSSKGSCGGVSCSTCSKPHLQKIVGAIMQNKPIRFVLPAFPGKSPNPAKVLGTLPDMAEQLALDFLNSLCERVKQVYAPGAQIILCSDGRVFSDVVGLREDDVTAYQREIDRLIEERDLSHISTFNLDDVCEVKDFDLLRQDLMEQFGQPLDTLKEKIRKGADDAGSAEDSEVHRMYCGITKFLFEDSLHPGQTLSRTTLQKDAKLRAVQVIRRSNAWSELIAKRFPEAIRLSIHPQTCGSSKLGIQLLGTETWMTPWHGVAVDTGSEFVLMKRWEAEKLNADIVHDNLGRPSHFKVTTEQVLNVRESVT